MALPPDPTLRCENFATCGSERMFMDSWEHTIATARAKGWHIFDGASLTGKQVHAVLCDVCVGSPRRTGPRTPPLRGDQTLFDM